MKNYVYNHIRIEYLCDSIINVEESKTRNFCERNTFSLLVSLI